MIKCVYSGVSVIIYSILILALVLGLIALVFFKIKVVSIRIILTITILLIGLLVEGIGAGIFFIGDTVAKSISEQKSKDEKSIKSGIPVLASTGEKKDIFSRNEVARGNGIDLSIVDVTTIVENKYSRYDPNRNICGVEVKIKNIFNKSQTLSGSDFQIQSEKGTIFNYYPLSDKEFADYVFKPTEIQPNSEINQKISFDCEGSKKPLFLLYKGGEFLNYNIK